jgi:hypothetical protein
MAIALAPGVVTMVGFFKRPSTDSATSPNRPSVKLSVTVRSCAISTSIPSKASQWPR